MLVAKKIHYLFCILFFGEKNTPYDCLFPGSIGKEQSSIASSLFHVARSLNYATMFISDETESFKGDDVYADHNALPFFHAINRYILILCSYWKADN